MVKISVAINVDLGEKKTSPCDKDLLYKALERDPSNLACQAYMERYCYKKIFFFFFLIFF